MYPCSSESCCLSEPSCASPHETADRRPDSSFIMFSWPRRSIRKLAHGIADGREIVVARWSMPPLHQSLLDAPQK